MDLTRIYAIASDEQRKKFDDIAKEVIADLAQNIGYTLTQKVESHRPKPPTVETPKAETPAPPKPPQRRKRLIKFPLQLHGLNIPDRKRLLELYDMSEKQLSYRLYTRRDTIEEIFPEPPPPSRRETIIKKKDNEGKQFYAV